MRDTTLQVLLCDTQLRINTDIKGKRRFKKEYMEKPWWEIQEPISVPLSFHHVFSSLVLEGIGLSHAYIDYVKLRMTDCTRDRSCTCFEYVCESQVDAYVKINQIK